MWTSVVNLTPEGQVSAPVMPSAPDMILIFGRPDWLSCPKNFAGLRTRFPASHIVGCSTGTVISGNTISDEGSVAIAIGFERTKLVKALATIEPGRSCESVGVKLGAKLNRADLKAVFLLSEGLDVNASALIDGLAEALPPGVYISGGLAGDGAGFNETYVFQEESGQRQTVCAIGFYGKHLKVGQGTAGGWDAFGPKRLITRSEGNVLYELDGKPALDLYERYLGEEAADLPASGLFYPLKIIDPNHPDEKRVRTMLGVDHQARSITFAGDIPQGWQARLMQGELERLIEGAKAAADQALTALHHQDAETPELSLLISCVGRRLLMGQRTQEEVNAVTDMLGRQCPQIGFYSYGEIAPLNSGGASVLHNQTVTITLFAEAA